MLQSVLLSFSLLPILHFTSSDKIMGRHKTNRAVTALIWALAFGVLSINIYLVVSRIGAGQPWWAYTLAALVGVGYLWFSYSLVQDDVAAGYQTLLSLLPESVRSCLPRGSGASGATGAGASSSSAAPTAPGSPDVKQQLASPLMAPSPREEVAVGVSG